MAASSQHISDDEILKWQQVCQRLFDELEKSTTSALHHMKLIQKRRVERALHQGIKTLPHDITRVIFEEVARSNVRFAIKLCHVCKDWRGVALATPRLWNRIDLCGDIELARAQLERSKSVPLEISTNGRRACNPLLPGSPLVISPIFNIIGASSQRWRSFV